MTKQSEVIDDPNYRAVLDHGYIGIVDSMGSDAAITQAARVSYGAGTRTVSDDRGLVRYLLRHSHTTPLEMCEIKWHVKLPIFVARQWIRHRTANVNEVSARYSEMSDEFYLPDFEDIQPQAAIGALVGRITAGAGIHADRNGPTAHATNSHATTAHAIDSGWRRCDQSSDRGLRDSGAVDHGCQRASD